ncbi:hypothetical protein [Chroococcus sp. FPU101]|uniref:hypothetical protein n=1 Tax=Chroococcus sp. FPU101 TaxID=1974212 RepID=UPI001A8F0D90|nr:hypothetical protein [Chroococcus sp. FPU101]
MATQNNEKPETLFNTPNPTELKEQAQKESIVNQYSSQNPDLDDLEMDDNSATDLENADEAELYFEDAEKRALSSSPIINANLSGS